MGIAYQRLHHALRQVSFIRSSYFLTVALREALQDSPAHGRAALDRTFEPGEDPFDYSTSSYQQKRIHDEVAMLDAVRGPVRFGTVLEVGCAEGIFTEVLAPRCESLVALDISQVALERARRRLGAWDHVRFAEWDLRVDPVPGIFDAIVLIHVFDYIRNPFYVRRARTKLVDALRPGGYLLLGSMSFEQYENGWWCRYLLRSAKQINAFFAQHPALRVVRTADFYIGVNEWFAHDVLFQKAHSHPS